MKKYDHLFSLDPIGALEKIEQDYARYFETAFKIYDCDLNAERMKALMSDDNMSKEPYIEVLPEYSTATGIKDMNSLASHFAAAFGDKERATLFFRDFITKGLMPGLMDKYLPYGHQIGMLEKAFAGIDGQGNGLKYKNTVITSGTGSGKTEAFLLPLFADIFKEAVEEGWGQAANHTNWYTVGDEYTPRQRKGDTRPAAIRGIILYPMNALVEDQLARLREALDSNDVRNFMNTHLGGNRIYFGSYNGSTIAKKNYDLLQNSLNPVDFSRKKEEVAQQLNILTRDFDSIKKYASENPDKKEALYISPRLDSDNGGTSEMITRWDMQKWAPDIMITNISMLSIMLMRKAEEQIFNDTRKWLAAEDLPEAKREEAKQHRIFHVIVDELHLYRGTAGSEVACLLRMLYHAIGIDPVVDDGDGHKVPNPQLRILASSASLGNEDETQKFMEEFFGVYSTSNEKGFNIQRGSDYFGENQNLPIDYSKFKAFTPEDFVSAADGIREETCNKFVKANFDCDKLEDFCNKYQKQIFWDFHLQLPENSDDTRRPISQSDLTKKIFGNDPDAMRGFLIFRGYVDSKVTGHKLPRFRFHKFFKYIEGLWGELHSSLTTEAKPVVHLSYTPKEIGPDNRKVLELLRCENCGRLFIGGNKKRNSDGSLSLTLNSPNLDQIPNFNPTPMVQNKTYRDYALFWPQDIGTEINLPGGQGGADHVAVISSTEAPNYDNGRACWVPGYLNAVTGKFTPNDRATCPGTNELKPEIRENGIQGFLYTVVRNDNRTQEIDERQAGRIYAAPCACPHCLQDYTRRKYTHSPIRSFRAGIDRSNQILSKELIYQLDEKSAKLIGFSDSREDAARQALGIEREQYRDMVRMLFVESVNEIGSGINDIIYFIKRELKNGTKRQAIRTKVCEQWGRRDDINAVTSDIFDAIDDNDYAPLEKYRQKTIPLSQLIGGNNFPGTLVRKLLQLGINPAGEAFKYQWYQRQHTTEVYHWSEAYDFTTCELTEDLFRDNTYSIQIKQQLENAVFANSFGKYIGVSVLDAGIGYICGPQTAESQDSNEYGALRQLLPEDIDVYEFVDGFIRVMGDNYLYPNNEVENGATSYNELKAAVKKPIRKFCTEHQLNEDNLGNALESYLKRFCTDNRVLLLQLRKLSFIKMTQDTYLKCPKCGRVHPNMGFGFCTNSSCMHPLDSNHTVKTEDLHKHYISFDILEEPKKPMRLHCEELSGQTDDIETRLHEFKDIILVDDNTRAGKEKTMPIDMLCVTTTMEVGVDIGSLQAIYQGNMPPTRYNYQQRVGRGGRRGQAFSTAFTFCRGRSHDIYYYTKAIDEMVGGISATPNLSLAPYKENNGAVRMKKAIMKRVVVKEILHLAYKDLPYNYQLQDTAGEFGVVGEWSSNNGGDGNKIRLENWIRNNPEEIEKTVQWYFGQFNENQQIQDDINEIVNWVKNELVNQIDNAVSKAANHDMGLARYLAESGFLPMYGMPSDARCFYHGFDNSLRRIRSIDRSSEMAISEFTPSAEKTKDKGKYRVEGLTIPIKEVTNNGGNLEFYDNNGDALADRYILSYDSDHNINEIAEAPANTPAAAIQLGDNQKLIVIPQAYRSLKIRNNTGMPIENQDRGNHFSQVLIFARDNNAATNTRTVGNVKLSSYELGLNEDPTVWRINNNNGSFYTGSYGATGLENPTGGQANFMFFKKRENKIERISAGRNTLDIALGAKKITEMIKLELKSYPGKLDLSLDSGNSSAIRAAYYSAAFLLQRALADKLDIQPDEIEVCEKIENQHVSIYLSDALPNGAGIVSYLYQDGKLEELIKKIVSFDSFDKIEKEKSFMQSMISDEHRHACLTACQKCLLTYNNRGFHHILDWRLGIGLLRLMLDANYDFGFTAGDRDKYEELKDWNQLLSASAAKLGLKYNGQNYWVNDLSYKIIYHPLWKKDAVSGNIPLVNNANYEMYNTFKLLRSDLTADHTYRPVPEARRRMQRQQGDIVL